MKYYLHDTSAFEDEKIIELFIEFGYEGVGLFYVILEKIGKQEKPIKTKVLKSQLKVGKKLNKCWNFMEYIGLIHSNNGETFNKQLLNFSEKYQVKKEKNKERIAQWRENQTNVENVTHYETVCNIHKVKESKVKESKVNNIPTEVVFNFKNSLIDYGFEENLVDDWLKIRKSKKATNTETAFKKFISEIEKTNKDKNEILEIIITKSWKGFENAWLNNNEYGKINKRIDSGNNTSFGKF